MTCTWPQQRWTICNGCCKLIISPLTFRREKHFDSVHLKNGNHRDIPKQPKQIHLLSVSPFSFISTPGAALAVTHHIMMTQTASLLRGNWFPKIRGKRHRGFSSFCNAVLLFSEGRIYPTDEVLTRIVLIIHKTDLWSLPIIQSMRFVLLEGRSRLILHLVNTAV